jgi:hypothetical protein
MLILMCLRSGVRVGHATGPLRVIHLPGKWSFGYWCAVRVKIDAAPSRMNQLPNRNCTGISSGTCIEVGTTVQEVEVCHLCKRVVFDLHHESNTSNHFNCSQFSTSSDCLYGAAVCSCISAYTPTDLIPVISYHSVCLALFIVASVLLLAAFLLFLHSSGYIGTCYILEPCW